jgi:hypothetical protein
LHFFWLQYLNPYSAGEIKLSASKLASGSLHSFVSEGHDGDVVVTPSHPSFMALPFLRHHDNRAHGNAWIEIDISVGSDEDREYLFIPDHYGLRSASGEGGKPRSWVLEGCKQKPYCEQGSPTGGGSVSDRVSGSSGWVMLSEHNHDTSLELTHCSTAAWAITHSNNNSETSDNETAAPHQHAYRYFRIVNTGNNSSGNRCV